MGTHICSCVHCGKCVQVCPLFLGTKQEEYGPRAKVLITQKYKQRDNKNFRQEHKQNTQEQITENISALENSEDRSNANHIEDVNTRESIGNSAIREFSENKINTNSIKDIRANDNTENKEHLNSIEDIKHKEDRASTKNSINNNGETKSKENISNRQSTQNTKKSQKFLELMDTCLLCGRCEKVCPQKASVPSHVREYRAYGVNLRKSVWKKISNNQKFVWKISQLFIHSPFKYIPYFWNKLKFFQKRSNPSLLSIKSLYNSKNKEKLVSIFSGCTDSFGKFGRTEKLKKLLIAAGYTYKENTFSCCGGSYFNAGLVPENREKQEELIGNWQNMGRPILYIFCSSCLFYLEKYPKELFLDEKEYTKWQKSIIFCSDFLINNCEITRLDAQNVDTENLENLAIQNINTQNKNQQKQSIQNLDMNNANKQNHKLQDINTENTENIGNRKNTKNIESSKKLENIKDLKNIKFLKRNNAPQIFYHKPCHAPISDKTSEFLINIFPREYKELADSCCGFGGILRLNRADILEKVTKKQLLPLAFLKEESIFLVSSCSACVLSLQKEAPNTSHVVHFLDIINVYSENDKYSRKS